MSRFATEGAGRQRHVDVAGQGVGPADGVAWLGRGRDVLGKARRGIRRALGAVRPGEAPAPVPGGIGRRDGSVRLGDARELALHEVGPADGVVWLGRGRDVLDQARGGMGRTDGVSRLAWRGDPRMVAPRGFGAGLGWARRGPCA